MMDTKLNKEYLVTQLNEFFLKENPKYRLKMAFLYGSCAYGVPRRDSDIDVAVLFSEEAGAGKDIMVLIEELTGRLERLTGRETNILVLTDDFAHPMLYYNAIVHSVSLFTEDDNEMLELKMEAIRQMEDFQLFGPEWQKTATERNLREAGYV